jgi:hypothetical protein
MGKLFLLKNSSHINQKLFYYIIIDFLLSIQEYFLVSEIPDNFIDKIK